jgi:hypothetical protein
MPASTVRARISIARARGLVKEKVPEPIEVKPIEVEHFERKQKRDDSKELKRLIEENQALHTHIDVLTASNEHEPQDISVKRTRGLDSESVAWIDLSDMHLEKVIDAEVLDGQNYQTLDRAVQRIGNVAHNAVKMLNLPKAHKIKKAVINFGGDGMEGFIHEDNWHNNSLSPLEAQYLLEDVNYSFIKTIKKGFKGEIIVLCEYGNHPRTTKRKHAADAWKFNHEYFAHKKLQDTFKNDDQIIEFRNPKSGRNVIEILGHKIEALHGDQVNYNGGVGTPLIPIFRWIGKKNRLQQADLYIIHHFHWYVPGAGRVMINGSTCGLDGYGYEKGFAMEEPKQIYFEVNSEAGITARHGLLVNEQL